jgi:hypothetical protein
VIIMAIIAMSAHFILSKTYFGRFVYAVGGNEEAARLAGIPVERIKLMVFSISSFFVAISAVVLVSRAGSATSLTGVGTEFSAITACILGGVSFKGGSGRIGGVVIGVLILGVLANGMQIIGLGTYPQFVARGIVFLAAIGFDTYQKSIRNSRHKRQPASCGIGGTGSMNQRKFPMVRRRPIFCLRRILAIKNKLLNLPYAGLSPFQCLDLYYPETGHSPFPLILAIHGGAWMMCDKGDVQLVPMLKALDRGYAVASLNYRLSWEAKFPAQIQDIKAAIRFLRFRAKA